MFGKTKRKEEKPVEVDLPITPMLDMSFQLMAFFIFTFKPMAAEGQLAMFLPKTEDVAPTQAELPPDVPEDKVDEYKVLVTSRDGDIATLAVQGPASVTPIADVGQGKIFNLTEHLKSITKPADGKKAPTIKIEAQNDLAYAKLIELMDVCRRSGFDSIGVGLLGDQSNEP
jgi:biopolymer transport protein ExbD